MNIDSLAIRIQAEFLEMPGLQLTLSQAQRLWGLDPNTCRQVVETLVASSVLRHHRERISLAASA